MAPPFLPTSGPRSPKRHLCHFRSAKPAVPESTKLGQPDGKMWTSKPDRPLPTTIQSFSLSELPPCFGRSFIIRVARSHAVRAGASGSPMAGSSPAYGAAFDKFFLPPDKNFDRPMTS